MLLALHKVHTEVELFASPCAALGHVVSVRSVGAGMINEVSRMLGGKQSLKASDIRGPVSSVHYVLRDLGWDWVKDLPVSYTHLTLPTNREV